MILPQDRSFKAFLTSLMQSLTLADGKVLRTIWYVVSRPGFVSREFSNGRRVRYLRPIQLFFALNLLYFLFPVIQLFNASLNTQRRGLAKPLVEEWVARKMIAESIHNIESFSLIYDQKTASLAKLIVMVFVVIAALPLSLLYRKRGYFFIDHMGLMVELVCFNLFINALLLTAALRFFGLGHFTNDLVLSLIFLLTNFYFLIRSGWEFYRESNIKLVVKTILMIALLRISLEVYRGILFVVTMWLL